MKISRSKRKRARAVADFERKDDDELGRQLMIKNIEMSIFDIRYTLNIFPKHLMNRI